MLLKTAASATRPHRGFQRRRGRARLPAARRRHPGARFEADTSPSNRGAQAVEDARTSLLKIDQLLAANRSDWLVNESCSSWPASCAASTDGEEPFRRRRAGLLLRRRPPGARPRRRPDLHEERRGRPAYLRSAPFPAAPCRCRTGLTRLQSRFLADPARAQALAQDRRRFDAPAALAAGLVTVAPDELDWDDELRLAVEERLSLSPDALTGMEASLRFGGPETADSKIYGRLRRGRTGSSSAPTPPASTAH